ncbi:hypothetical protein Hanom_Chr08g00717561 [Helianthus anomalus]
MFTSNFWRCPFAQKFTSIVLYLLKSCTFCPLVQTWLKISVKKCIAHECKMVIFLSTLSIPHLYPSPTPTSSLQFIYHQIIVFFVLQID